MPAPSFWTTERGETLAQGDLLFSCRVPVFYDPDKADDQATVDLYDLIVVTQSCDLANNKVVLVACCPIFSIEDFERVNPVFQRRGEWEQVRRGRHEGLHLLGSPVEPDNNREALVVDFREIYALPFQYLSKHAAALGPRWRLVSPYLEHFSQTLARFFMRVGLPTSIPPYK